MELESVCESSYEDNNSNYNEGPSVVDTFSKGTGETLWGEDAKEGRRAKD